MTRQVAGITACFVLIMTAGCGDGETPVLQTGTAEGLWRGTLNPSRTLNAAVLDDGTYYFLYSAVGDPAQLGGVIQGSGSSSNGTFNSSDAKDFGIGVATRDAAVSASFGARQFLNGSVTYTAGGTQSFSSSYNTAYDTTPSLASLAGVYQGQAGSSVGSQLATMIVQFDGTFSGSEADGCTFSGAMTARVRGNMFDLTMTFGGSPCLFGSATLRGATFVDSATAPIRLYAAAPNSTRTNAAMFLGVKTL